MFKPLLAGTINSTEELDQLVFPVIASPKLDGIRTISSGNMLYTRSMKKINSKYLQDYFNDVIKKDPGLTIPYTFDGELTCGYPGQAADADIFNKTTSAVMSHDAETPCTYWIFDLLEEMSLDYLYRLEKLNDRVQELNVYIEDVMGKHNEEQPILFRMLPYKFCNSVEDVLNYEIKCLSDGYEGIMLRNPSQRYKCGRSSINPKQQHLLKLKRFADAEAIVVSCDELMHNNNEATKDAFGRTERSVHKENLSGGDTLGALVVKGLGGTFDGVQFKIGTGFSSQLRNSLWASRESLIGKTVVFKYQECGVKDAPRFPVYKGFRGDE